jgi:acyl carrier protein
MSSLRERVSLVLYDAISSSMRKPIEQLNDGTRLVADLGAKSVNLVTIIAMVEDELDLDVPFGEFRRQNSIGEIIDYVVRLCTSKSKGC